MDLNAKIEARRREKAQEAQEAEKLAKEQKEAERRLAKEIKDAEELEIKNEAARRLELLGVEAKPEGKPSLNELKVELEVQKALNKAASDRMTTGENAKLVILSVLGLVMLFMAWPVGVVLLVWAFLYHSKTIKRHTTEIIAEGEKRKQIESGDLLVRSVYLLSLGDNPGGVKEIVRKAASLGVNDTNDLLTELPCAVLSDVPILKAEEVKGQLVKAGATVEIRDDTLATQYT